jgi:uracil-DNA glycosylase
MGKDHGMNVAVVPDSADLAALRTAAAKCTACELWAPATQTVFGEGPADARIVFVGEQPGDIEDRKGLPFVGPAGRLLDRALEEAGIDRATTYVTNAVKHFRFEERGKRRIHKTPGAEHITACHPWLRAELTTTSPEVIVCLGATAARAMLGPSFRITKQRGQLMPYDPPLSEEDAAVKAAWIMATPHPSAVLRVPDESREAAYRALVDDLKVAASALAR